MSNQKRHTLVKTAREWLPLAIAGPGSPVHLFQPEPVNGPFPAIEERPV